MLLVPTNWAHKEQLPHALQPGKHAQAGQAAAIIVSTPASETRPACPRPAVLHATPSEVQLQHLTTCDYTVTTHQHDLLLLHATVNGQDAVFVVDSGSTGDFISDDFVHKHDMSTMQYSAPNPVRLADGTVRHSAGVLLNAELSVLPIHETVPLRQIKLHGVDGVLGKPWLTRHNPAINWQTHETRIHLHGATHALQAVGAQHTDPQARVHMLAAPPSVADADVADTVVQLPAADAVADAPEAPNPDCAIPDLQEPIKALLAEYADVFTEPDKLPPARSVEHVIDTLPDATPPCRPMYRLSLDEGFVVVYLDDILVFSPDAETHLQHLMS
mmetsp:Transcript_27406/g.59945  ORF Transcript_27406/g.59945 Transcript_27406/m.59945 type:complete len:330 (+) Transcript_27406:331-1320(+)